MNIGIDFNTKMTRAAFLMSGSNVEDSKIIEVENILVVSGGDIFVGDDGFNKFITEKDAAIYDLDQIIELNGPVINKRQLSVEKCLSIIFTHLLKKIKACVPGNEIDFICVSIPFEKYYYWYDLIKRSLTSIGKERVRIISQPAAFFCRPKTFFHNQSGMGFLFISVSQSNTNVSLVNYSLDTLEVVNTQYTNSINRKTIEYAVLDYFIQEISRDSCNFAVNDKNTRLRILEVVNDFLRTPQTGNLFELNLPHVLCDDGGYRTLDTKIDLGSLHNFLTPTFNSLTEAVKQLALKAWEADMGPKLTEVVKQLTPKAQEAYKGFENVIFIGDLFIQQNIRENLPIIFNNVNVILENEKLLAIGALNFSKIMTGEKRDFLALEVVPFPVLVSLNGGEFVEMIEKDRTIPDLKEQSFEIKGERKSRFVEVHLATKDGDNFQSISVWKIKAPNVRVFKIVVDIDAQMKIGIDAHSESGKNLSVQKCN